jgi:hypothetical protein
VNSQVAAIDEPKNGRKTHRSEGNQRNGKKSVLLFVEGQGTLPLSVQVVCHEVNYCLQGTFANFL